MKTRILLAALPLAAFIAACDDPSGPGEASAESRVSIAYTGAVSGTFVGEGSPDLGSAPNAQTFASATRAADGTVEVVAYGQRGGSRFDVTSITIPNAAVGQAAVEVCPGETCPSVSLALDLGRATGSVAAHTCHLDEGSIRVTSITQTRVKGTVSGSGYCIPGAGGDFVDFSIASGTFDVQIRTL
jgi:hypothetical protein